MNLHRSVSSLCLRLLPCRMSTNVPSEESADPGICFARELRHLPLAGSVFHVKLPSRSGAVTAIIVRQQYWETHSRVRSNPTVSHGEYIVSSNLPSEVGKCPLHKREQLKAKESRSVRRTDFCHTSPINLGDNRTSFLRSHILRHRKCTFGGYVCQGANYVPIYTTSTDRLLQSDRIAGTKSESLVLSNNNFMPSVNVTRNSSNVSRAAA